MTVTSPAMNPERSRRSTSGPRAPKARTGIEEALMVGVGSSEPMDYHALEAMQCMIGRRCGGETGVKAVQMIEG